MMDTPKSTKVSVNVRQAIVLKIGGKEFRYQSVDEMPPEHRKVWEQAQAALGAAGKSGPRLPSVATGIRIGEKTYGSVDEIPDPALRAMVGERLQSLSTEPVSTGQPASEPARITCPACRQLAEPVKGWFGRRKCSFCGARLR